MDYREDKPRSESLCASIRQSNKRHFDSFLPLALATAWAVKVMENTCHATYFINKEKIVPVISEKETEPEQRGMIQQHRWA